MRIVFYSASTSAHSNSSTKTTYQPFRADTWDEMDRLYPDCEFVVAGPLNGSYIFDVADGEICKKPEKVKYVLLESGMSAEDTAELIAQQRPDIAVAIASGAVPFDWVPIKTALIAEELQKRGIATIANNTLVSVAAFDKWRSNIMFRSFVKAAKGIYIHHELFLAEKKNPGVSVNVYKEYVFYRIKEINFPVIVKDTLGAGSIGVEIMNSYEEVESFLNSDRNNSDIMVEELIQGEQFGTEIHGVEGRYSVLPPIAFSVTKEGITDPLSSVKFGPVTDPSYHFEKVQEELSLALTEEMQQEAEHIRLGNAHSGIKIIINRMQEIEESYIQQYQSVAPPLLAISKQIQKRLQRVFKDMSFTGKESALLMGRRIEPRLLMDREGRFFSRNRLPSEKKSLAVAVLMDESGSMADQDRVTYARAAGIIIYDFCKAMDVPILIMGHTDDSNVQIYAYTDFDSMDKMDRYRLMDLSARYGNRDGAALRYVAERLLKQPEEKKLLLLVSDGQPAGTGGYLGSAAEADLRGIKKEYTNKGILFVAAAIGDDKENIERIYGDAFLEISDLTKLPFLLVKKIEKELKG